VFAVPKGRANRRRFEKSSIMSHPCHAFGEGSIPWLGYMDRKVTFKGENFLQTSITFFFTFSGTAFRY